VSKNKFAELLDNGGISFRFEHIEEVKEIVSWSFRCTDQNCLGSPTSKTSGFGRL
jgi:hypothetical protein